MGLFFDVLEWNDMDIKYSDYITNLWGNYAKYR